MLIPILFTAAVFARLVLGWHRDRCSEQYYRPKHGYKQRRDGKMNRWAGEISEEMSKRIWHKVRGERLYSLYVGNYHRGRMA